MISKCQIFYKLMVYLNEVLKTLKFEKSEVIYAVIKHKKDKKLTMLKILKLDKNILFLN